LILKNTRAAYGEQIVVTLSRQLVHSYGSNFEEKNLRRNAVCIAFSFCFTFVARQKQMTLYDSLKIQ